MSKKKKSKPLGSLIKQASTLAQLWARIKDADSNGMNKCITCGKVDHYKNLQGGHYIERGKAATRLDPININPQDAYCNMWGMKKVSVVLEYRNQLIKLYGEQEVLDLEQRSRQVKKWNRIELEDLITELKSKVDNQLSRMV